jgi:hypothetical protein
MQSKIQKYVKEAREREGFCCIPDLPAKLHRKLKEKVDSPHFRTMEDATSLALLPLLQIIAPEVLNSNRKA